MTKEIIILFLLGITGTFVLANVLLLINFHIKCSHIYGVFYLQNKKNKIVQAQNLREIYILYKLQNGKQPERNIKKHFKDMLEKIITSTKLKCGIVYNIETHNIIFERLKKDSRIKIINYQFLQKRYLQEYKAIYGKQKFKEIKKRNLYDSRIYTDFYSIHLEKVPLCEQTEH